MAALTVRLLQEQLEHELGDLAYPMEFAEYVSLAGNHLCSMYAWQWLQSRMLRIRPRAAISLTGATWTEATKTITKVGAFADYDFLSADTIEITDGSGATAGHYTVASNPTDDTITLTASIGAAADGQTDIAATMPNDQLSPAPPGFDVAAITGYQMSPGLTRYMQMTTPQELLDLRSWNIGTGVFGFWAILNYVRSTTGGQPEMRLDLWPSVSDTDHELVLFYRAGWIEPADDDDILAIPGWLNLLFVELLKAIVKGYEEPERGSVDARLTALRQGVTYLDAIKRDATTQTDYGPMRGGWLSSDHQWPRFRNSTVSANP